MIQPADPATGKPGMSFFIVSREEAAVVQAAHAFRGAAQCGCEAFPLDRLPPTLSLVADKVQLMDEHGTPVLLRASLSPKQPMSRMDFLAELRKWQGVLPCSMEGAAGAQDCVCESEEGEACSDGSSSPTRALLTSAVAKLHALSVGAHTARAQPVGGSPGL